MTACPTIRIVFLPKYLDAIMAGNDAKKLAKLMIKTPYCTVKGKVLSEISANLINRVELNTFTGSIALKP